MTLRWLVLAALLPAVALAQTVLAQTALAQDAPAQGSPPPSSIDQLLSALRTAPNEAAAEQLEGRIETLWVNQATPASLLLLSRGIRDDKGGEAGDAVDDFSAALDLQPGLPEALRQRAMARFHAGDYQGAVADIGAVVKVQPHDFLAFRDLSAIAESREDWKGAYAAWQKMMEIDPKTPGGQEHLDELKRKAFGQET
jgi:tetratricopeptide (TPR) repeat protein